MRASLFWLTFLLLSLLVAGSQRATAGDGRVLVQRPLLGFTDAERWSVHAPDKGMVGLICDGDGALLSAEPVERETHVPLLAGAFGLNEVGSVRQIRLDAVLLAGDGLRFTIRLRDRDGEVGQLPAQDLKPGMTALTWDVPADLRVGSTWGENCNGVLDPPLHLHELFLIRRPGAPRALARLRALAAVDRTPAVAAVQVELEAGNAVRVVTPDDHRPPCLILRSLAQEPLRLEGAATVSGLDGERQSLVLPVRLDPGGATKVDLRMPEELGIFWVDLALRDPDTGDRKVLRRSFARMAPAGPTPERAEGFLFSLCTHTERWGRRDQELEAMAAGLCGAKIIRTGHGWGSVEPAQGQWRWDEFDRLVAMYGKQGMEIQYLLGFTPRWASAKGRTDTPDWRDWGFAAPRIEPWRTYARTMAQRYGDRIRFWEVWNEPDIDFWRGTLEEYLDILRAAHAEIKAVNPSLQVMTGGFAIYDRNPGFIEAVVERAQPAFDIFAYHRHGDFRGFQAEVDGPVARLRARMTPAKPIYFNETAIASVGGRETMQAETLVKKLTFAWARGAMGYTWYDLRNDGFDPNDYEHNYGMVTHDFYPKAVYPTYNTLATLLRGKTFAGELALGVGRWGFAFAGGGETVIVAWNEDPQAGEELFLVEGGAAAASRVDLMANRGPALVLPGGRFVLPLSARPAFLVLESSAGCPRVVGPLVSVPEITPAVPGRTARVAIRLRNPSPEPRDLLLGWRAAAGPVPFSGEVTITLAGDEERSVDVSVPVPAGLRALGGRTLPLAAEVATKGSAPFARLRLVLPLARLIPPGSLEREPDADLREHADVVDLFEADPNRTARVWKGPADLSARVWLERRSGALHLHVAVTDDIQSQPQHGAAQWQGDGIQAALDVPGQKGYWELGFALPDGGGAPECTSWARPEGFAEPAGRVALTVRREGDRTTYDATLPMDAFGLTDAVLQAGVRFSLIVNDADGEGRDGWIQLSEGIGRGKDPSLFPYVLFE